MLKLLLYFSTASINATEISFSIVEIAKERLAQFLEEKESLFDPRQIILEETESVVWNDSSLGCAEKGCCYLQVLTPGYKIVFRVGTDLFTLHTDGTGSRIVSPDFV